MSPKAETRRFVAHDDYGMAEVVDGDREIRTIRLTNSDLANQLAALLNAAVFPQYEYKVVRMNWPGWDNSPLSRLVETKETWEPIITPFLLDQFNIRELPDGSLEAKDIATEINETGQKQQVSIVFNKGNWRKTEVLDLDKLLKLVEWAKRRTKL